MAFNDENRVCTLHGAYVRQDGRLCGSSDDSVRLSFVPAMAHDRTDLAQSGPGAPGTAAKAAYHVRFVSSDPSMCGWWLGATRENPHMHSDAGGRWPLFVQERRGALRWAVEPAAGENGKIFLRCLGLGDGGGEPGDGMVWIGLDDLKYSYSEYHLLKLQLRAKALEFAPSDGGPLPSHSDVGAFRDHLRKLVVALDGSLVGPLRLLPFDMKMLIASYVTDIRLVYNPEPGPSHGHFAYLMLPLPPSDPNEEEASAKTGGQEDFPTHGNFSSYAAGGASPGQNVITTWQAVRLDLETLVVKTTDFTFSSSTGGLTHSSTTRNDSNWVRRVAFARAADCTGEATGRARVDLTGTSFTVDDVFEPCGCGPMGEAFLSDNQQVVELTGGGYCGENKGRKVHDGLQLAPLPGSLLARAVGFEAQIKEKKGSGGQGSSGQCGGALDDPWSKEEGRSSDDNEEECCLIA